MNGLEERQKSVTGQPLDEHRRLEHAVEAKAEEAADIPEHVTIDKAETTQPDAKWKQMMEDAVTVPVGVEAVKPEPKPFNPDEPVAGQSAELFGDAKEE